MSDIPVIPLKPEVDSSGSSCYTSLMGSYGYDMSVEIWKWCAGVEGYQVSSWGRVKSFRWKHKDSGRIMTAFPSDKWGHLKVGMTMPDGKRKNKYIHLLVLEAFVGPRPEATMVARHYPCPDTSNNRLDNLLWGTPKENYQDMIDHGNQVTHRGEDAGNAKLTEEQVLAIRAEYGPATGRNSHVPGRPKQSELARKYGVTQMLISKILQRRVWNHV